MLKAAVIGCGRMGAEPSDRFNGTIPVGWTPISHIEAFSQVKDVELVALAENNRERLEWVKNHYQISSGFEKYQELLENISPDIISVATRTPEKNSILQEAFRNGVKGVYIEKPLSNSLKDAKNNLDKASQAGTVISYGVNRRYHSLYRQARDLIRSGEIGDVLEIILEFGESPLLWGHPHSVDLMLFFSEQSPVAVQAEVLDNTVVKLSEECIDSDPVISYAHFWFDGGVRGLITRGAGCGVRVNGTRGTLEVLSDGASIQIRKPNKQQEGYYLLHQTIFPVTQRSATVVALEELIKNVRGEITKSISHTEIYAGMQMLWGCVFSHLNNGQKILISDIPLDLKITGRFKECYA